MYAPFHLPSKFRKPKKKKPEKVKYAKEFYYQKGYNGGGFELAFVVVWVLGGFMWIAIAFRQAWHHKWAFIMNAITGFVWLGVAIFNYKNFKKSRR